MHPPRSLFDNTPAVGIFCGSNLNFDGIPRGLYKQHLQAIGICATSYSDADSVTFYACCVADRALGPSVAQRRAGAADAASI